MQSLTARGVVPFGTVVCADLNLGGGTTDGAVLRSTLAGAIYPSRSSSVLLRRILHARSPKEMPDGAGMPLYRLRLVVFDD